MSPPVQDVVVDPALRAFSPVCARMLEATPLLARFLDRVPTLDALTRVNEGSARRCLRLMRKRALVHTAWQELQGASPLVTARLWSDVADACIALADRVAFAQTARKFGVMAPGRSVLALGKLGSRELNPSSDVDVVCVYRSDDAVSAQGISAHEWFTGWARRLRSILADVDDDGFCFRVDFDLRPEGTQGPLVNSVDAVESYYERFGRTWERAALLRLRPVVDVDGAGSLLVKRLSPFVFAKSLDARIVDELFAMKAMVTEAASGSSQGVWDVKRGHGGIREVEFVAQSLQLLHGGRLKTLQGPRDTASTLLALGDLGLLPHATTTKLMAGYELLRRVEHALQLGEDRQTQLLPASGPERSRVDVVCSRALARPGRPVRFEEALATACDEVHDAFVRHLGEDRSQAPLAVREALDPTGSDDGRRAALTTLGFPDGARALELLRSLERRRGSMLAPSTLRELPARVFVERMLEQLGHSVDPQAALERLPDIFATRLHPALLAALDGRATTLIARVLALSAPLSRSLARLARRGGVDDALLFGLNARRPSLPALDRLLKKPDDDDDDEGRLSFFARTQQELVFAAALPFLAGRIGVIDAQHRLSVLADALLRAAVDVAAVRLRRRHGSVPGLRFAAFALGSLGGRELGFFRDLDLAFVYDADDDDQGSDGQRSIPASEWAVRMAQQVLWVLTTPTDGAALYPVDTRLRPSGNQGALTTSITRFAAYHQQESALWERQALLRLRFVAGDRELGRRVVDVVAASLSRPPPPGLGLRLLDMRARMVEERAAKTGLDIKLGEGGAADVEFAVQGAQLAAASSGDRAVLMTSTRRALARLARRGHLKAAEAQALRSALDVLFTAREALALVDDARSPAVGRSDPRLDKLARSGALAGVKGGDEAWKQLVEAMAIVRDVSGRILMRLA
ncbi:MAG: hypothetical protein Q8O67_28525 [Deltaproteobacteria bacterium]|nr:hypothetical protein [Deltaproteobacteria bacterium]